MMSPGQTERHVSRIKALVLVALIQDERGPAIEVELKLRKNAKSLTR